MHDDDDDLGRELLDEIYDDDEPSDDDLLSCPSCRRRVHEDTQQCPHCGDWITPVDRGRPLGRILILVTAVGLIAAMILLSI